MKKIMELRSNDKGQGMVEFIFVLPFLLLLVFSMAETGMILNAKITATQAARQAARSSVILPKGADYATAAESNVATYMANVGISSGYSADAAVLSDDALSVTVIYEYIPSFIPGLPNPLQLESTVVMRIE
ncbi:TadE/TadG family type IV pilus assembly protein [Trichococcus alkaliphilus]|uniref:TadE/TadG family type IV pilus assembly protein n=1 Tax=Trichococcus alkaliphilus TaxID=2052943 RepID=UPI00137510CE|nr:TadE/TadG family type IV pilus assembly protein [Trichococcus alkaliphilus]